jgi:Ca-activated chloride channel family protein
MSMLADFHFLRPGWLLLLALAPLIYWYWQHRRTQAGNWQGIVDAHLLPHLVDDQAEPAGQAHVWLAILLLALAGLALAGPAWERQSLPLLRNDAARILALELAPTMLASDIKPSRLERARYKLNDILDASRDMQTALIGYSGDAFVAAPLTDDANTVRNLIDALGPGVMPVTGNDTARAIDEALKLLEQAGSKRGELILLADSAGTGAVNAARDAQARGLRVSVLGIGSAQGAPVPLPQGGFLQDANGNIVLPRLDEAGLRAVAAAGGGRYATLSPDRRDLELLLAGADDPAVAKADSGNPVASERFLDRGPWLVLLILPLALLAFRRGWLMLLPLVLLAPASRVQAMEWIDLWQRPDQQAAKALAEGDVERARAAGGDPSWRGSAEYRAGDFAAAAESFARASGAQALYNRGNALAGAARYEDAIDAYRQALEIDPGLEDAAANKKAVEEWLRRQQSSQTNQRPGDGEDEPRDSRSAQDDAATDQEAQDGAEKREQSDAARSGVQQEPADNAQKSTGESPSESRDEPGDSDAPPADKDSTARSVPDSGEEAGKPKNNTQAATDAQQRAERQASLAQAIDKALDSPPQGGQDAQAPRGNEDEASREQRQAYEQWLQRVPDDPGGLLRRKFQLEHERRQRDGGGP